MIKTLEDLMLKLNGIRQGYNISLRMIESQTGILNATIWRVCHGKEVDYSTGKKLEEWVEQFRCPRKIKVKGIEYMEIIKK